VTFQPTATWGTGGRTARQAFSPKWDAGPAPGQAAERVDEPADAAGRQRELHQGQALGSGAASRGIGQFEQVFESSFELW
jgi:hypothetical protein